MSDLDRGWRGSYWFRVRTQQLSRRRALGTVISAGTVASLVACGRSKDSAKTTAAGAPAPGGQAKPTAGGTINAIVLSDPSDWDITYQGKATPNDQGFRQAYSALLGFKSGPNVKYEDLTIEPRLAESWETPDGQNYSFHLRKGVAFANLAPVNGRALSAADVKWSYEYLSRTGQSGGTKLPAAQDAWMFEGVTDIQTPDASTVLVRFDKPFAPFINYAASDYNPIFAHEIFDQDGNFKNRIVGTGAWQLDPAASQKGTRWVWRKNPTFWESGKPYIDQISWLVVPDEASGFAAFQTGQVNLLTGAGVNPTPQAAEQIKKARPDAVIDEHVAVSPLHLYMNVGQPPLNDLRARQAISLSIDRDEFVQVMTRGKGGWALAGAFPDTFTQAEIKQMLRHDPAQAKSLLAAAGYSSGLDLEFIYPGNAYGDSYIQEMELLQAQLKNGGINLVLKNVAYTDHVARKKQHNYTITMSGKDIEGDVDSYLYAVFYPGSVANYGNINDPGLTPLLDAERHETDSAKRKQVIRQAVQRINGDQVWALALFYPAAFDIWAPQLRNYAPNFGVKGWPLEGSWLTS